MSFIQEEPMGLVPVLIVVGLQFTTDVIKVRFGLTVLQHLLVVFGAVIGLLVSGLLLPHCRSLVINITGRNTPVSPSSTRVGYLPTTIVTRNVPPPTALPTKPPSTPEEFSQFSESDFCMYVVQPGDTVHDICARFQVSEDAVRANNYLLALGVFRVHQQLVINAPCCRPVGGQGISHVVQRRETLKSIARRYGTTPESIVWANHIYDLNYIQEGQMLCIPYQMNGYG
jgi:LysM repeat protein